MLVKCLPLLTLLLFCILYLFPAPVNAAPSFVTVAGDQLIYQGSNYFVKGANVGFGRYLRTGNRWQMYYDFHPDLIEQELIFLKHSLGINTLRIWLPEPETFAAEMQYRGASPNWFNSNGSINPIYRDRLIQILDLCDLHQLKVQLIINGPYLPKYTDTINHEYVPLGSDLETFWYQYVDSLVPSLKDHPAILSYEILNESLINWPVNGESSSWLEPKILSFTTRMLRRIRTLDSNHLFTSSELIYPVTSQYQSKWWYPAAEYAILPDVDNLNNGQPYSLYSQVDYLSPHLYSNNIGGETNLDNTLREIRLRSQKPIILGEFGYYQTQELNTGPESPYRTNQEAFFTDLFTCLRNNNYQGLTIWDPWPLLVLEPGFYTKQFIDGQYPVMVYTFSGRQSGTASLFAVNDDQFWLFKHDLSFFPAGSLFAQAFSDYVPNLPLFADINDNLRIDLFDLKSLTSEFGRDYLTTQNINSDINRDGFVDYLDYLSQLQHLH